MSMGRGGEERRARDGKRWDRVHHSRKGENSTMMEDERGRTGRTEDSAAQGNEGSYCATAVAIPFTASSADGRGARSPRSEP